MSHIIDMPVLAPALPASWKPPSTSVARLSPLQPRNLLPSGPAYLAHVKRVLFGLSFEDEDRAREEQARSRGDGGKGEEEDDLGVGDEEETEELLSLDPKEWKKQDHYAVLGLSHLRYQATPDQIKVAHRKKVLKHHPDKKASAPGHSASTNDDAFFKCIQKAFEVLHTFPDRRRQFDSVDPAFDDDAPSANLFKGKTGDKLEQVFFREFGPVFEREARFSKKQPVPLLGVPDDSKEKVEGFYDFWYNFDSWRSFEYLDKEVNEGSDNRDDKRYTEKKNKSERARRKKEDTARLRSIVDFCLGIDPRIKRIKQEEKAARQASKARSKTSTPSPADLAVQKAAAEEEAKKKEEEEKMKKAEAKKAKSAAANAAKKARRAARAEGTD